MAEDAKTVRGRPASTSEADAPALPPREQPAIPPSRYVLGAEIARGGMGRVVEATDTLLGRVVALKEALSSDPDALERFAREIRITARLEHPSIVPVHDGGKGENGVPYYVMRKIEGRPLEKLVRESRSLNDRLHLVRHMVAAAEAIAHAHERMIVHRDIKPSNILVGELGETIVIDWGLAKVIGEDDERTQLGGVALQPTEGGEIKTREGLVFGTPGFMAPEQLGGGPVDPRWDVYALGATLYHLLSKKPPHHADSADDMMRAAMTAPPSPIANLVQGVPPELATIVDKALSFDPDKRYQDARELARDLQRFLGGQLVAAHHYTPRQKISRYVIQHRYAFIVGAIAIAALMVGGAFAFVGIRNERDRADDNALAARRAQSAAESAQLLAERKTEDLSLSSARSMASTNPTFALSLVKPLVAKRWREVRAIAAEARAAGVAWSLPASPAMRSLQFSSDGRRVLGAGGDGIVRLYDLDARSERTLVEARGPVSALFADDEKKLLVWSGTHITIVDIGGSGRREIDVEATIVSLDVIGTTAYWVDAKEALWQMELSAVAPRQIPLDENVTQLAVAPNGRYIALAGAAHVLLYDPARPTEPAVQLDGARPHAMDWASDGSRLAILAGDRAIEIATAPTVSTATSVVVGDRAHVLHSERRVFTIGPTGIARVGTTRPHTPLAKPLGLEESQRGTIVAAGEEKLLVIANHSEHTLAAPSGRFSMMRASTASPYVVAVADEHLYVWNLDEIEPRVAGTRIATAKFVTGDDLVATTLQGPAQWMDLATGNRRELGTWPAILDVTVSPSGRHALVVDMAHVAHLVAAGAPPVTIKGSVDRAVFTDDGRAMLIADDAFDYYDIATGTRSSGRPWDASLFAVTPRSQVFVANGAEIRRLPSLEGRGFVHHATLPHSIAKLDAIGIDHLLAITEDGAAYLVALAKSDSVTALEESLGRASISVSKAGLVAVLDRGAIDIVDPLVQARWRLASGSPSATYADVQISADGRRVLAKAGSTLLVWDLLLPTDAVETAAWLDKMTNAIMLKPEE